MTRRLFDYLTDWSPNHRVQIRARRHHRIDAVFLDHAKINQDRFWIGVRGLHRRDYLFAPRHALRRNAVRCGEFAEIWTENRRGGVAALVEKFLPLAHHAQIAVVDDRDVDL